MIPLHRVLRCSSESQLLGPFCNRFCSLFHGNILHL
jgi:hypothetical protein